MTTKVTKRPNYRVFPGHSSLVNIMPEKIEQCIERVFMVESLNEATRRIDVIYAKHFYRYVLERLTKDNKITDEKRVPSGKHQNSTFKHSLNEIGVLCSCDHSNILHSAKTALNLIKTDKEYKLRADAILNKIECNLITMP